MRNEKMSLEELRACRYFPSGSIRAYDPALNAEWAFFEVHGEPGLIAYQGRRLKSDIHRWYSSTEKRKAALQAWLKSIERTRIWKTEQRKLRQQRIEEFLASLKPDQIFYNTWGYEQTQVEFYKIREVRGRRVELIQISYESVEYVGPCAEYVKPDPSSPLGAPFWKTATAGGFANRVGFISRWEGRPVYRSWGY
jgi:hypothetical protein